MEQMTLSREHTKSPFDIALNAPWLTQQVLDLVVPQMPAFSLRLADGILRLSIVSPPTAAVTLSNRMDVQAKCLMAKKALEADTAAAARTV